MSDLSPAEQSAILTMTDAWTQASRIIQPPGVLESLEARHLAERRERPASPAYPQAETWWRLNRAGMSLQATLAEKAEKKARREAVAALAPQERARLREQARRRALLERRA